MLLEAKWTQDPLPASSIYQFRGKIEGKLVGTIGVFISMSGFSANAVDALVAGKIINTILFDGDDMRAIAADQVGIGTALDHKLRAAAEGGTPYLPLRDQTADRSIATSIWGGKPPRTKVVLVEGRFEALLVHALADELGPSAYQLEVVPAGGALNLTAVANLARAAVNDVSVVIIADGEGDPEAVRRVIVSGLYGVASGGASRLPAILVFDPSFEQAIGVPEGFAEGQRRDLKLDNQLLRTKIRRADVPTIAEDNTEVRRLLTELGLADQNHGPHA